MDKKVAILRKFRMEGDGVQTLLDKTGLNIVTQWIDRCQIQERLVIH